jgi:hypothetical protein
MKKIKIVYTFKIFCDTNSLSPLLTDRDKHLTKIMHYTWIKNMKVQI